MDQSSYINAFVDVTVGQLHEVMGKNLHLQTQLKMSELAIAALTQQVEALQREIDRVKEAAEEEKNLQVDAVKTGTDMELNALRNKVRILDTAVDQMKQMKKVINEQETEITNLKKRKRKKKEPIVRIPTPMLPTVDEQLILNNTDSIPTSDTKVLIGPSPLNTLAGLKQEESNNDF